MVTSFSCKTIKLEEIVKCAFTLNKTEYDVLTFLLEDESECTATHISKKIGRDRTTIQRALTGLLSEGLVKRVQRNLKGGGYVFLYRVKEKNRIKEIIQENIYEWYKSVEKMINRW
jgi:predicted transcriptional regulator